MSAGIVTLLTDFGTSDGFAASMKGVLLGINPQATLIDISHEVPAQDIAHGAFVLGTAYRYFSSDSVHVAVVDPGVGTRRRAVLLVTPAGMFLAPDNGLLTYVLLDHLTSGWGSNPKGPDPGEFLGPSSARVPEGCAAYELTNPEYWRHPVSNTFHGRDVFAPAAAHASLGVRAELLGEQVDTLTYLNVRPSAGGGGRVIFVDRFGNLVSNVRSADLAGPAVTVEVNGKLVKGLGRTYAEADGLVALIGSHGYLEIAEREASAASTLRAGVGTQVKVLAAEP